MWFTSLSVPFTKGFQPRHLASWQIVLYGLSWSVKSPTFIKFTTFQQIKTIEVKINEKCLVTKKEKQNFNSKFLDFLHILVYMSYSIYNDSSLHLVML